MVFRGSQVYGVISPYMFHVGFKYAMQIYFPSNLNLSERAEEGLISSLIVREPSSQPNWQSKRKHLVCKKNFCKLINFIIRCRC